ncbi:MAG: threonine synthase [Acidobacteriota bacterium]|nr:threonine synthase [Acidobacteriota bacterium]
MICISTRGTAPAVPFREAVVAGLAPDGGLYVPATLERRPAEWWDRLRLAPFQEVAVAMAQSLLGDEFNEAELGALIRDALNFPVPIVRLDESLRVVELFHGPTFAFKDFGARTLARFLSHIDLSTEAPRAKVAGLTVLVATSGDTGSAVAQAFWGLPHTRVVVLYPEGQVSAVQEAQFTTLGGNVVAVAVAGTFDDCQGLAKQAFADEGLRQRVRLTSANSISLGRLVPQMFYYAYAALHAPPGARVVVSVPSGNFGNLVAGVMAWRMGAPIAGFVAATNVNDTVPRYLQTGRYQPRPSVATVANAMDVGAPSNFERLEWLFGGDRRAMSDLITANAHTDADVKRAIAELHTRYGYVADPHTAIAYLGTQAPGHPSTQVPWHPGTLAPWHPGTLAPWHLFLGTAHPAKFREVVEPAIGQAVVLPGPLAEALARPRLVERISPTLGQLAKLL